VPFPIYIGAILRRGTQNSSYIYRKRSPISVKVYAVGLVVFSNIIYYLF